MTNYRNSKISSAVWAALNTISFPTPHGVAQCGIVCSSKGDTVCNMWSYEEVGGMCLLARVSMWDMVVIGVDMWGLGDRWGYDQPVYRVR